MFFLFPFFHFLVVPSSFLFHSFSIYICSIKFEIPESSPLLVRQPVLKKNEKSHRRAALFALSMSLSSTAQYFLHVNVVLPIPPFCVYIQCMIL